MLSFSFSTLSLLALVAALPLSSAAPQRRPITTTARRPTTTTRAPVRTTTKCTTTTKTKSTTPTKSPSTVPIPGSTTVPAGPAPTKACPVAGLVPVLPSGLAVPAGQVPVFVALGRGVQNYTCGAALNYTSIGAIASLYDASCINDTTTLADAALKLPFSTTVALTNPNPPIRRLSRRDAARRQSSPLTGLSYLGLHIFVTSTVTNAIAPQFDFGPSGNGAIIASKTAGVNDPDAAANVAWLQLNGNLGGSLASTVFRIDTAGGQPPKTCTTVGEVISVDYAAMYWFTK